MKKSATTITVASVFFITTTIFSPIATAAPSKAPTPINCKVTKAKGHTAKNITPPEVKGPFKNKTFTFTTNCGDVVIEADSKNAPVTVFALSALANGGFFDQSLCHRLTTNNIYVLQCGDPTATGSGGPNFSYRDENLPANNENNYPAGTVSMAESGGDKTSQFYIFYKDSHMSPNFTIWGKVTKGLEIIQTIAKDGVVGDKPDGEPKQKIAIEKVRVR